MNKVLNESTLIPISAITIVFACAAWLTTIYKQGEVNAAQISEIKSKNHSDYEKIEYKLDKMNDKIDKIMESQRLK